MKARIFMSHSSKDPPATRPAPETKEACREELLAYARQVRDIVQQRLDAEFEVWLDKSALRAGDDWRAKLHRWLGTCDGAVILLDRESLASAWLLKEATILAWRRDIGADVKVVPVLLGRTSSADVDASALGGLELMRSQAVRVPTMDDAARAVTEIAKEFSTVRRALPGTPMERWIADVRKLLTRIDDDYLLDAAAALGIGDDDWSKAGDPERDLAATLAHALLYSSLEDARRVFQPLVKGMGRDGLHQLYELVHPVWVDVAAAQQLNQIMSLPTSRVALIAARYPETAEDYIQRARHCDVPPSQIISAQLPVGTDPMLEGVARFQEAACAALHGRWPEDRDTVEKYLTTSTDTRYVVLGPDPLPPRLLASLRDRYERLRFVVLRAETSLDDVAGQIDAEIVRPVLSPDAEDQARSQIWALEVDARVRGSR